MRYAKLTDTGLTIAPRVIRENGRTITNPHGETLREYGWKPLDESAAMPEAEEGFGYADRYTETEDAIVLWWEKVALPEPEPAGEEEPQDPIADGLSGSDVSSEPSGDAPTGEGGRP